MIVRTYFSAACFALLASGVMATGCGDSEGDDGAGGGNTGGNGTGANGTGTGTGDGTGTGTGDGTGTGTGTGGDLDCVDACDEAQAGSCTSVTGDCGDFCDAIDNKKAEANCEGQVTAYDDCLNDGTNVCDNNCGSEETALTNCFVAYCALNQNDADCVTLANSF